MKKSKKRHLETKYDGKKILFTNQKETNMKKTFFTIKKLIRILSQTIKSDVINKLVTTLCFISTYTDNSQFNIIFVAPSSSGKTYIPSEIANLFPKEDIRKLGYSSATAFFHDHEKYNKEKNIYYVDLERKILIFLDQSHSHLAERLRPVLSHDEKKLELRITDKNKNQGLRTKRIIVIGFPSAIFCTANAKIDEQETTRFILLSPEINPKKIEKGIRLTLLREHDQKAFDDRLKSNSLRKALIKRIRAIRSAHITQIKIHDHTKIEDWFFKKYKHLKPRHLRDIKIVMYIIQSLALLNFPFRKREGSVIWTTDSDVSKGLKLYEKISLSQEIGLPPYIYNLYKEVILPLYIKTHAKLTRKQILNKHFEVYGRALSEWQFNRDILPALERAGLVIQEPDPNDRRRTLIVPIKGINNIN